MVTAGEIIVFGEAGGGGHVTTCVAGSGATAMVVDNAAFGTVEGQITNLANDGSSSDITIAAAHLASLEWTGVQASTVVIYELDTPIVTTSSATASLAGGASCSLGPLFSATDPAARPIVEYQIYDTSATDSLLVNGAVVAAHSAATAATANSLASVFLSAGSVACADTLDVRAFNGSYWGDWQSINFTVSAASSLQVVQAPIISAPQLNSQTPNQNWFQGASVSFTLPTNTFVDPQGQALTYAVRQANGQALPSWLTFDGASETFSGTVPVGATALSLLVSATDQSGLSASETFQVAVPAASPPILANPTSPQAWRAGRQFSLTLPTNTFVDPQNENLSYTATQFNGLPLPRWLSFNPSTKTFSGTAPITPQTLEINVTAIDSSGLSAAEFFSATVLPSNPILTNQTPNQIWQDGGPASFMLPSNTFSDPNGLALTYTAHEMSGPDVTSWLRFNGNTGAFSGNIPTTSSGAISIEVVATNTRNQSASETFGVTFASVPGHLMIGF
jgi:hypothetical protein